MTGDLYRQYYEEKFWEAIPSIYRHEDGLAEKPGVLRAIVQVLADQAAILRRSQDRLWDDQFIDLCDEWAVPYIGDLVATRLLSALNKRGRRIDVAKTIYYRRRKGTPRILEELIFDISGWEGVMVEQFRRLARSRHGLDAHPQSLAGKHSGTLPGGWADVRNIHTGELTNGPFEEFFYTPDVRKHHGLTGRYAIPKLAFYLYRLEAFPAIRVTPFSLEDAQHLCYSFDPSGRDIPLFSMSGRSSGNWTWDQWSSPAEAQLPAPIPCRLLGQEAYRISYSIIQQLMDPTSGGPPLTPLTQADADELKKLANLVYNSEASLRAGVSGFLSAGAAANILGDAIFYPLLSLAITPDSGKSILLPANDQPLAKPLDDSSVVVGFEAPGNNIIPFSFDRVGAANLDNWLSPNLAAWLAGNPGKQVIIDAEAGRFMLRTSPAANQVVSASYYYGFSGPIGAGSYERTNLQDASLALHKTGGGSISAAELFNDGITQIDDSKTYGPIASKVAIVNMTLQSANFERPYLRVDSNWILNTGTRKNSRLILDGLWIGSAGNVNAEIIIRGDYKTVVIKNCTLDPGGSNNIKGEALHGLPLVIEGIVNQLCIISSIAGSIRLRGTGLVDELFICDSIIQSENAAALDAIDINSGKTVIERSTVFGNCDIHRLEASESFFTGNVNVVDTQHGCFRFSGAPQSSRLPRPYESFLFAHDSNSWFTSRRFGDPGYAQLSELAPTEVQRGAENGSEMGAFSSLLNPIKFDGLQSKIDEYMPFGLIPIFINKT
jgi:hypothetical protein